MMSLHDREALRARWRRALTVAALDSTTRDDFARGVLAQRLADVTVQALLLPVDPESEPFPVNDASHAWLSALGEVELDGMKLHLPEEVRRTAHALARVRRGSGESWRSYLAIHRSGAIEWGLGDDGGWSRADRDGDLMRSISLAPTVARTWALLQLATTVRAAFDVTGPLQLTVGIRASYGAELGSLGEGWAEPGNFGNRVGPCQDQHLLWHLELDEIPDDETSKELAYAIGDRIEGAWGVAQRRYLANRGPFDGRLDPRRW